jgi:hypothetical protein
LQAVCIAEHQVNLTSLDPEVGHQEFHALLAEIPFGSAFAQLTVNQVRRLVVSSDPG